MNSGRTLAVKCVLALILILIVSTSSFAGIRKLVPFVTIGADVAQHAQPAPTPEMLSMEGKDRVQRSVYEDIYSIFLEENECRRFFGGVAALEAVNALSRQLRRTALNESVVGVRMIGQYANFKNARTGLSYRMFDKAILNSDGPFYRNACLPTQPCVKSVGRFPSWTREARMLMMLHELAHLVKGDDGKWLIPDDGDDPYLSASNTRAVEKHCYDTIRDVVSDHFKPLLARRKAEAKGVAVIPRNSTEEGLH
jgi:hypothetical protein